ncbi:hypothetical protein [Ornithinimicrobium cerasi]|uniref:hypothetical protein n=1 Tax=Ornithinimicrobium cerasi TaxID=2248773 RepID=UPI000EFFE410|nr:hypothetical protein [Ornithinimicrobium cerasi]
MRNVTTRRQALADGLTAAAVRHLLATGRWQRLFPGVYLTHSGSPTWRERLLAATLARGDGAVASLECALVLWGLGDREPQILTLAEPWEKHRSGRLPGVRVRRRRRMSTARRYGIPVTSAAQTVLDVLALPGRTLDDDVALVTRAVSRGHVTVGSLRAELRHHPQHPRRSTLAEVLTAAAEGFESVAEVRYVDRVERPHGLPSMERQVPVDGSAAGGRVRRLDFKDRERGIGMEIDGELYHRGRQVRDRGRDREVAGTGEVTLRAGWFEVTERPCELAVDVALVQIARGWQGRPRACGPTCPVGRQPRLR